MAATRLEVATSAVTALRELVLQQLTNTRGLPNYAVSRKRHRIAVVSRPHVAQALLLTACFLSTH